VHRPVTVDDPRVAADVLVHPGRGQFAWLVSHAAEPVTIKPQLAAGARLAELATELAGGPANGTIILPPFGVGVFRIEDARPAQ
jgi:hypothetical protein